MTDFQHAVDAQASDDVMPDVMKIGGVTGWLPRPLKIENGTSSAASVLGTSVRWNESAVSRYLA